VFTCTLKLGTCLLAYTFAHILEIRAKALCGVEYFVQNCAISTYIRLPFTYPSRGLPRLQSKAPVAAKLALTYLL